MLTCPHFAPRMGFPGRRADAQKPEAEGLPAAVAQKGMRPFLRVLAGVAREEGWAMTQYWLVGAEWNGCDMTDIFVRRGYWQMGYHDEDNENNTQLRNGMQPGDAVAIKRWHGGADRRKMTIRAIGTVRELGEEESVFHDGQERTTRRVYIEWKASGLQRIVDAHGCSSVIRPPVTPDLFSRDWFEDVFRLV